MNEWLAAAVEKVATQPTSADQLIAIAILAISPTLIGPLPIFVDLLRRNGAPSWIPWFVMGFWTLAAVVPMLLSAAGLIDREKMMYGGFSRQPFCCRSFFSAPTCSRSSSGSANSAFSRLPGWV